MNIFVLDRSPVKAAQMLCDAHVVKMIVESAQLLSTHDRLTGRFDDPSGLYKPTHVNHPCRKCLDNKFNRAWLICYLDALLSEYYHRYRKTHKTASVYHRYYCCSFAVESMTHSVAHGAYASRCTFLDVCLMSLKLRAMTLRLLLSLTGAITEVRGTP